MMVTNLTTRLAHAGDKPSIRLAHAGDKPSIRLAHDGDKPYNKTCSCW